MLCLNCIFARDEVPERVEVEAMINEEIGKINIANELKELWKFAEKAGYSAIVYCEKLKEVKVGSPPSPTETVTECTEFTEA